MKKAEIEMLQQHARALSRAEQIIYAKALCDDALVLAIMDRLNEHSRLIDDMNKIISNIPRTTARWDGESIEETVIKETEVETDEVI